MQIDLAGRVRNTKLPYRLGLMPVFEAVINSLHSIQDARLKHKGFIHIEIERESSQDLFEQHGNTIPPIKNITVVDDGLGFNEANFNSFYTLDSRMKASRGAKGIGRLLWLKTFDSVEINSTYKERDKTFKRFFKFEMTARGLEDEHLDELDQDIDQNITRVKLLGFKHSYRDAVPKSAEAIARRIVEHCLEYFLLGEVPIIKVIDPSSNAVIHLDEIFLNDYRPEGGARQFEAGNHRFDILDVFLKSSVESQHKVHFCAHNRVVQSMSLTHKIPHLETSLVNDDDETLFYSAYVSSDFLDQRVDMERTSFHIDRENQLAFQQGLTWEELTEHTLAAVKLFLNPKTEKTQAKAYERINHFIMTKEPKYRPLLEHRKEDISQISGSLSEEKLDLELHKALNHWRRDVRVHVNQKMKDVENDPSEFETHQEEFKHLLGELQEVAKSDLAGYVVHRATVLDFFEKLLGNRPDGKSTREDAVHELFFPMKTTSNQVDFDDHNLWVIDEKLAYHQYLASDLSFSKQEAPVDVTSSDRPDILVYNKPLAFIPGSTPYSSCVVIEFKRPNRNDYNEDKSPIRQVFRYVDQIRQGKAKRDDGSALEVIDAPFYCYVIATLTPTLKAEAIERGFTETPDRMGFFSYNANYKAYIEISSFRKVLDDAKKRNRAFFDRLQIRLR